MNIGLNLVGFIPGMIGGVETYLRNIVNSLQSIDHDNSYVLLCDDRYAREFLLFNESFRIESINYTQPSFLWLGPEFCGTRPQLMYRDRATLVKAMPIPKSGETVGLGGEVRND
jgi:hypothetical protein